MKAAEVLLGTDASNNSSEFDDSTLKTGEFLVHFFQSDFFLLGSEQIPSEITRNYSLALENIPIESLSLTRERSEPPSLPAPWVQI